ncbi:MAG TPA: 5'-methylthioadenosine/adenosylhomocysteine nucleosidase [Burkholderiaceae bacterium]|jgi:adenosylhomocysteine nucleosidase
MPTTPIHLGLISALKQEQTGIIDTMQDTQLVNRGMRDYVTGKLWEIDCTCVLSRIGKVAAATTVATLIERFNVTHVLFTGVAGSADPSVAVGDIVVAESLIQHDMNTSPLFPRFEVPLTGVSRFPSDKYLSNLLTDAAHSFITEDLQQTINATDRATFNIGNPKVHQGLLASGDEFITDRGRLKELKNAIPELLAVEMEGAAVAQVCFEFGVPFSIIRTISDNANEDSPKDFMQFIDRVAAQYAFNIIRRACGNS